MPSDTRNLRVYMESIFFWIIVVIASSTSVIERHSIFSALCLPVFIWMLSTRCCQWFYILTLKEAKVSLPDEVNA